MGLVPWKRYIYLLHLPWKTSIHGPVNTSFFLWILWDKRWFFWNRSSLARICCSTRVSWWCWGYRIPSFQERWNAPKKTTKSPWKTQAFWDVIYMEKNRKDGGFFMAMLVYRRVCKIRMFPKIVVPPKSSIFIGFFHYGPSILGVPLFLETPIQDLSVGEDQHPFPGWPARSPSGWRS